MQLVRSLHVSLPTYTGILGLYSCTLAMLCGSSKPENLLRCPSTPARPCSLGKHVSNDLIAGKLERMLKQSSQQHMHMRSTLLQQ